METTTGGIKSEINITPLVDVVLVLLVIFMVVTPMLVSQGINLPQSKNGQPEKNNPVKQRTISLTAQGLMFFEQEPVSEEVLLQRLHNLEPGTRVVLKADMAASYGAVHHILDLASGAGFRDLALLAEPAKKTKSP